MNPRTAIATACLFASLLAGCGSDDGDAPEGGNELALFPANFFDDINQSFNLAGGNTDGDTWTGTLTIAAMGEDTFAGENVVRVRFTQDMVYQWGPSIEPIDYYFQLTPGGFRLLGLVWDVDPAIQVTTAISTRVVPLSAATGDEGLYGSYLDDEGDELWRYWRVVETAGNGRQFQTFFEYRDANGDLEYRATETFDLDEAGNYLGYELLAEDIVDASTSTTIGN